jgi:hypothetical protein
VADTPAHGNCVRAIFWASPIASAAAGCVVGTAARCCSAGDLDTAAELPVHHLGEDVVITALGHQEASSYLIRPGALLQRAEELLASPPDIKPVDVLAAKLPT